MYNLGNHRPEKLLDFIAVIERELGNGHHLAHRREPPDRVPTRALGYQ